MNSMEIQLNENFRITTDNYNYILQEQKLVQPKDDSKEQYYKWDDVDYYGKLEHALNSALEKITRDSDIKSLEELKQLWIDVTKQFINAVKFVSK